MKKVILIFIMAISLTSFKSKENSQFDEMVAHPVDCWAWADARATLMDLAFPGTPHEVSFAFWESSYLSCLESTGSEDYEGGPLPF